VNCRECFVTLVEKLKVLIGKKDTNFRRAIDTPRRVAVYLSFVGRGLSYSDLAVKAGIGKTSVFKIIRDVSAAIIAVLKDREGDLRFPSDVSSIKELEAGFRAMHAFGLPGACGALDGSHFPIKKPSLDGDCYLNRKRYPSIAGLFVASADCYCLDALVGYPGSVHDSRMWRESGLRRRILMGEVPLRTMEQIEVCSRAIKGRTKSYLYVPAPVIISIL
jgi:hypothetical protein